MNIIIVIILIYILTGALLNLLLLNKRFSNYLGVKYKFHIIDFIGNIILWPITIIIIIFIIILNTMTTIISKTKKG